MSSKKVYFTTALKIATFVPIVAISFYIDLPVWLNEIFNGQFLGLLVAAAAISSYGIFLKRRIIAVYLDLSRSSFVWGLLLLFTSISLYFVGSLYFYRNFFHFASLLFLILSYSTFRFDRRITRQLVPLLAIVGLPFAVPELAEITGSFVSLLYISLLMLGIFAFYVGRIGFSLVPPILAITLELIISIIVSTNALTFVLMQFLVPLSILIFLIPKSSREKIVLKSRLSPLVCNHGGGKISPDGFCLLCSRKVGSSIHSFRPSFSALIVLVSLVALVLVVQVPVLTISGGTPSNTAYRYISATSTPYLPTPSGWMINSSKALNLTSERASEVVYVPTYHPETENYSVLTALGNSSQLSLGTGTGEDLPGWKIVAHNQSALNQYAGYSTVYQKGNVLMINFAGFSRETFWNGSAFNAYNLGLSLTRDFNGVPLSNASAEFNRDIRIFFSAALASDAYSSSWTHFLSVTKISLSDLLLPFELITAGGLIAWAVYRIKLSDYNVDGIINDSSELGNQDWKLFSSLSSAPHRKRTVEEISSLLDEHGRPETQAFEELAASLERLRDLGLVKSNLAEMGPEIFLTWKVLP